MSDNAERYGKSRIYRQSTYPGSGLFTSPPFRFIVDGIPVYIHASLVSKHSKPLERMIHGQMVEAQQGFAVLKEVDEGTFTRFAQWAYKGYYSAAEHEESPEENHKQPTSNEKECEADDFLASGLAHINWSDWPLLDQNTLFQKKEAQDNAAVSAPLMLSTRQDLKEAFISREFTVRQNSISIPPPRANRNLTEDYTGVFLSHARLYVFADQYDIQPLKTLALEELQLTLASFTLYPERTGDIIALMRYSYANTCEPVAGVEDIRTMLTAYMSYEVDTLMKDKAFKDLMVEDGGALLGEFIKVMEKRIPADDLETPGSTVSETIPATMFDIHC